jgi:hypothetical protein
MIKIFFTSFVYFLIFTSVSYSKIYYFNKCYYDFEKNFSEMNMGQNSFIIQGIPADVISGNEKNAIELLLEQFKHFSGDIKFSKRIIWK